MIKVYSIDDINLPFHSNFFNSQKAKSGLGQPLPKSGSLAGDGGIFAKW